MECRRARVLHLLTESDRITALSELVGVPALPAPERMTPLGGQLLREAVLQQNALSDNDAHCSAAKAACHCGSPRLGARYGPVGVDQLRYEYRPDGRGGSGFATV